MGKLIAENTRKIRLVVSFVTVMISLIVMVGWVLDLPLLMSVLPGANPMRFNTALLFLFLGIIIFINNVKWSKNGLFSCFLSVLTFLIALYSLAEHYFHMPFDLSNFFLKDTISEYDQGMMSISTAYSFIGLSLGNLLKRLGNDSIKKMALIIFLLVGTTAMISVITYILELPSDELFFKNNMAIHTSLLFIVISYSFSSNTIENVLTELIYGRYLGSRLFRNLLPFVFVLTILLSFVLILFLNNHWVNRDLGIAFQTASIIVITLVYLVIVGLRLNTTDKKQKKLEKLLTKELTDYKNALDVFAHVSLTDTKGVIMYVNDRYCEVSGYTREELIGKSQHIVNSGYHPREFWSNLWNTIRNGYVWHGEIRNKTKGGQIFWEDTTIIPFRDENGSVYQYLAIRTDVTNEKNQKQQIINSIIYNQEKERELIAENLHEGLAQTLVGLSFQLGSIEEKISADCRDDELIDGLKKIREYITDGIENTKDLALDLMPRAMMDYGIIASIEYYILKLKNNAGFEITLTSDGKQLEIEKKGEIALYRVLVSLISLIRKHEIDEFGMHFKCESPVQVIIKVSGSVQSLRNDILNNPEYGLLQKRIELHGGLLKFSFEEENNYTLIVVTFND